MSEPVAVAPAPVAKPTAQKPTEKKPTEKKPVAKANAVKAAVAEVHVQPVAKKHLDPQAEIATIAYGYWVSRGYQGGSPAEDWFRAEAEFAQRYA